MKTQNTILVFLLLTALTLLPNVSSSTLKCGILTFNNMSTYNAPLPCPEPTYVDQSLVNNLLNSLSDNDTEEEKVAKLEEFLQKSNKKPISPAQALALFQKLNLSAKLEYAVGLVRNFLNLTSVQLNQIVGNASSPKDRVALVEGLFSALTDRDVKVIESMAAGLPCKDRKRIQQLLISTKPKDCILGDMNFSNIVYILDVSGSMAQHITVGGKPFTRISYLKEMMRNAITQMKENQKINLIFFSWGARYMESANMIQTTPEAIERIVGHVNALRAGGATNISGALQLAFNINDNIDSIVFITDGSPTVNIRDPHQIRQFINRKYEERKRRGLNTPPVNMNLLMIAGVEPQAERNRARIFSETIADATNGSVKSYGA